MGKQLNIFGKKSPKPVNVASVPHRSPFRYPGGKTWLIPTVRKWLNQAECKHLIEPFAGGGIVSLSAVFESLAQHATMVELDEQVAAVWEVLFSEDNKWLSDKILTFDLTRENANAELTKENKDTKDMAFCTILKNRIFHGGILARGSGMIKKGENGKGISSRWYAKTLAKRMNEIDLIKHKIDFYRKDGFEVIEKNLDDKNAWFFIDPPYTVAGRRLYTYFEMDHEELFRLSSKIRGRFMLTYDDTEEIRGLAKKYDLKFRTIPMKTNHHLRKQEIIVSDNFDWWDY